MFCQVNFQPSWKQEKQFNNCHGAVAIPAEVFKAGVGGGGGTHGRETDRVVSLYVEEVAIPHEFKDISRIHLYKQKGNPQVCDNHRGISLPIHCWEDTGKNSVESPERSS